ncbi:putative uncharacterized protein C19orf81 isoform X2 [Narcine bancroftii]|uniref:putative uncharacterized protein C19orf81 isoform X2 n=1 Tax=Narcine bancroftii TaxID=1343680 RepID=UPI0038321701
MDHPECPDKQSAEQEGLAAGSINLLSETINATKSGRSIIFKSTKKHLKQFISKYEALDTEMPGIRKFEETPSSHPLTLCVECPPEMDHTHRDVMSAAEAILPNAFSDGKITSIQFENVNVICGSSGLKNSSSMGSDSAWDVPELRVLTPSFSQEGEKLTVARADYSGQPLEKKRHLLLGASIKLAGQ